MGWRWQSIETVPQSLLDMYELGTPILLDAGPTEIATAS
jgi:hypothetical protein